MNNLILLRHGQSQWNLENRFTGWKDVPLTDKGITEAKLAGQLMRNNNIKLDLVFSSKLKRANQTAEIAIKEMNLDHLWKKNEIIMTRNINLNERDYGDLVGLNKEETANKYGKEQVHIWRRSYDTPPPNGESLELTAKRTLPYFSSAILPQLDAGKNIFVAAHGNSLRSVIMDIEGLSREEVLGLEVPTGTPIVYERIEGNWKRLDNF